MGLLGVSLIVASVVYLCVFPKSWIPYLQSLWTGHRPRIEGPPPRAGLPDSSTEKTGEKGSEGGRGEDGTSRGQNGQAAGSSRLSPVTALRDTTDVPPPPPPPIIRTDVDSSSSDNDDGGEQTTPKAVPVRPGDADTVVPTFSLSSSEEDQEEDVAPLPPGPPAFPAPFSAQRASSSVPSPTNVRMGPPPRPPVPTFGAPSLAAGTGAMVGAAAAAASGPGLSAGRGPLPLPQRTLPLPNRGPPAGGGISLGGGLAPPPTHTTKPTKPKDSASRKVTLTPGHSPLDWARLSSDPRADLRNLPPGTGPGYIRVTPSILARMNGRRGRDAWTVLGGGRVYNITPYLPFHPGGKGELLRCAGRDGTRLFGEVHPWVNYETMLAACLVGVLVGEDEGEEPLPGTGMEAMD